MTYVVHEEVSTAGAVHSFTLVPPAGSPMKRLTLICEPTARYSCDDNTDWDVVGIAAVQALATAAGLEVDQLTLVPKQLAVTHT